MFASKEMLHIIVIRKQVGFVIKGNLVFAKLYILYILRKVTKKTSIRHVPMFQNVTKPPVFVHVTPKKKVISRPRSPIWEE